jgi:hypothetical protein
MVGLEYVMLVQLRFVLFVRVLGMFVFEGWKDTAKTVFNTVLYSGSQGQILLTVTPTIIIIQFILMELTTSFIRHICCSVIVLLEQMIYSFYISKLLPTKTLDQLPIAVMLVGA